MKRLALAALIASIPVVAFADDNERFSHAPYQREKVDGEWRTTGAPNCDQPTAPGGVRYCPSGQWPAGYANINPVENPIFGNGGSDNGSE